MLPVIIHKLNDSIILGQNWAVFDKILVISFFFSDIFFFWCIITENLIFTKKKNDITKKKLLAFHITFSFFTQIAPYYQAKNRQIPLK